MTETKSEGARSFENVAWSRWFARVCLDYVFLGIVLGLLIGFAAPQSVLLTSDYTFAFVLVVGVVWLPIEAALIAKSGKTPGKALLGMRVVKIDGSRLTFGEAFGRATAAWIAGCGFLFPLVSLFTMNAQYKRVRAGRPAGWDEKRGFLVQVAPLSDAQIRTLVIVVVAILIVMIW